MKKFLLVIILFCISLLGCNEKHEHIDADTNGICDICKYTMTIGGAFEFEYVATENGHCSHKVGEACDGTCIKSPHEDLNHDNKCDICGFSVENNEQINGVRIRFTYNGDMATGEYEGKHSNGLEVLLLIGSTSLFLHNYDLSNFKTYHTHGIHKGDYLKDLMHQNNLHALNMVINKQNVKNVIMK